MKLSTLKGLLTAVALIAVIAVGITVATRLESVIQKTPDGAGTTSAAQQEPAAEETPATEDETVSVPVEEPAATPADDTFSMMVDDQKYILNEDLSTLLVLGTDDTEQDEDEGTYVYSQADFIVVAVFDEAAKTCKLLQINRNTMVNVQALDENDEPNGTILEQICLAHDYGSTPEIRCENTVKAVSDLLYGVPIDNYACLAMGGIIALNDTVGGVDVTIEDDFTGVDETLVMGETVHLMGDHAYNFVHARKNMKDDANMSRMRRQRAYMTALVEKLKAAVNEDPGFVLTLYSAIADYLVTDCEIDELSDYSAGLSDYTLSDIVVPEGEVRFGQFAEIHPDEDQLLQIVLDMFFVPAEE